MGLTAFGEFVAGSARDVRVLRQELSELDARLHRELAEATARLKCEPRSPGDCGSHMGQELTFKEFRQDLAALRAEAREKEATTSEIMRDLQEGLASLREVVGKQ
eukprot:gnl/TRDRNA2_/TRDRNA2_165386_c0_seq3.p1 gnl/TRDRNA2_/TRDRNA2_165386_c0~~gnl/TRDRNA2_/TRDRNA2_165386_c0_seq3.p1  ORF type:complete len:105 (-),score=17.46 gnl/TRDRNA2_/TRDRNA2_165386_c0_seq3:46-360(-)